MQIVNNPILNIVMQGFFGIFTILGFYFTFRKKYPKSIVYFETEKINLNSSVLKNFNDVVISYKEKEISSDIYLFRGFILNNGRTDLQKEDIENKLHSTLKDGKWLNCSISATNKNMNADFEIDNSKLFFNCDLLKVNEYVYFEALAETNESAISFNHRIPNLGKIKTIKSGNIEKRILKKTIWFLIIAFIVFLLSNGLINNYKSGSLLRIQYRQAIEKSFKISHENLPNTDTIINIIEPLEKTTIYRLGDSSLDTIADFMHKEYNVFGLILHSPDTVIEIDNEPLGVMKVSLNHAAITDLKTMTFFLVIFILVSMMIAFRLINNIKQYLIKNRIEKKITNL
jgi:hypothetical protein